MPPKKNATTATEDGKADKADKGSKAFSWDAENERKLLLMMVGTTSFTMEENERIAKHIFNDETTAQGVRQRSLKLRTVHRALYEDNGWTAPNGSGKAAPIKDTSVKQTPKGKKRNTQEGGAEPSPSPTKKGRKAKALTPPSDDDVNGAGDKDESTNADGVKIENGEGINTDGIKGESDEI